MLDLVMFVEMWRRTGDHYRTELHLSDMLAQINLNAYFHVAATGPWAEI
jgi:hypothetical protein